MKTIWMLFAGFLLAGCATDLKTPARCPPECKVTQLSTDTFRIQLPPQRRRTQGAEDYALLTAAKVAMEHDFAYFAIVDIDHVSRPDAVESAPNPAKASGQVFGLYGVGGTTFRPAGTHTASSEITVQCFPDAAADFRASNAKNIREAIEQKYGLDLAAL